MKRNLFLALALALCPSIAFAEEVSVGVPVAVGKPGDHAGYVNGTGYRPYGQQQQSPQQPQEDTREVPQSQPPPSKRKMTQEEAEIALNAMEPYIQKEADRQAMELATKRAKSMSWLTQPAEAQRFGVGLYLINLFGTTDVTPSHATGFGIDLALAPTSWIFFAKGRLGGIYQTGLAPGGNAVSGLRSMSLDAELTAGITFFGAGLRLGWYGTRQTWDIVATEMTSIGTVKATAATENPWQHGALFGATFTIRGVTAEGQCRVAAASIYDAASKIVSGTAGMCGIGLTGTILSF